MIVNGVISKHRAWIAFPTYLEACEDVTTADTAALAGL